LWIIFFVFFCCGITHAWGFVALLGNDNTEAKGMFFRVFWSRRVVFAYHNSNVKQQSTTVNRRCNHGVLTIQPWGFWTKSAMVLERKCAVLEGQVG
jgi:hypothetical protein